MTPQDLYAKFPNPGPEREAAVVREVLAGNVPSWTHKTSCVMGPGFQEEVCIDYLAFGTDDNFCRAPLTPYAAQYIADKCGYELPSVDLVHLIYVCAPIRLVAQPQDWYKDSAGTFNPMRLGSNYIKFNDIIQGQLEIKKPSCLIAGHKKDVIGIARPGRVTIYGWQDRDGAPIQGPFSGHDASYEDYSHGIRFCAPSSQTGRCYNETYPQAFLEALK